MTTLGEAITEILVQNGQIVSKVSVKTEVNVAKTILMKTMI